MRILMVMLCLAGSAAAAPSLCPEHFAGGAAPNLINNRLSVGASAICYDAFAVLHSATTRTALYSAEHLTEAGVGAARGLLRSGDFHAESVLPPGERAELSDYARSGFDRGHLAPSGDMPDLPAQQQSFSLANMVPQAPRLNRGLWEGIESAIRTLAERRGELFVVTGPIFRGEQLQTVGRVIVPSHIFKAVLDPARRLAGAYVAENVDDASWQPASMAELAQLTGMDIFPALPLRAKSRAMRLPSPTPHYGRASRERGLR